MSAPASRSRTPDEPLSPTDSSEGEDNGPPQTSLFLQHVSETTRQSHCVSLDHLYTRAWAWRSDGGPAQQTRLLLVNPIAKPSRQLEEPQVDVETVDEPENLTEADEAKARVAMEECQEHVAAAREVPDDLIERLDQSSWSATRRQLLRQVLAALSGYQLARRAVVGRRGAAFVARVHADRCAARVRRALAAVSWQRPLCQWLHTLMLQKLGKDMLAIYLEVLQTLTNKVPSLATRLTAAPGSARHGPLAAETLAPLLRRPWDPAAHLISQHKLKRLPNNPVLVLVPSSPCHVGDANRLGYGTTRLDFWHRQLSALGKVVQISECEGGAPARGISVSESLSHILSACRQQVCELRRPGRPLVLVGWGAAGLIAAHLALVEPVSAVVALGFPYWSPAGRRGEPDDPLLELRAPTLLLVGQAAADAAPEELELMRDRMRADTGLVVVGGADSRLLVNGTKMQREGLTQSMVDRAILEEISEFLSGILTEQADGQRPIFSRPPTPPQQRQEMLLKTQAREKARRKAIASAAAATSPTPQLPAKPSKRRADKPPKSGKTKKVRSHPTTPAPPTEPTPPPPPPAPTAVSAPPASVAATAPAPATGTTTHTITIGSAAPSSSSSSSSAASAYSFPSSATTAGAAYSSAAKSSKSTSAAYSSPATYSAQSASAAAASKYASVAAAAAAAAATASVIEVDADEDDSLSEAPIIDLIQDVDADADGDVAPPEPERTVTVVRPPAPVQTGSVKIITTPPYRSHPAQYGGPSTAAAGGWPPTRTTAHSIQLFGTGAFRRDPLRGAGRAGRLKVSQRADYGGRRVRVRGRGRSRGPQYGVAHEFGVAAAARLSAPVAAVPAPVGTSAGPGRIHPAAAERSLAQHNVQQQHQHQQQLQQHHHQQQHQQERSLSQQHVQQQHVQHQQQHHHQQFVYVQSQGGTRISALATGSPTIRTAGAPSVRTAVAGAQTVRGAGVPTVRPAAPGASFLHRQVVVSRGRARTVTYVPSPRMPEHEYTVSGAASAQPRYARAAVYPRLGRPLQPRREAARPPPDTLD